MIYCILAVMSFPPLNSNIKWGRFFSSTISWTYVAMFTVEILPFCIICIMNIPILPICRYRKMNCGLEISRWLPGAIPWDIQQVCKNITLRRKKTYMTYIVCIPISMFSSCLYDINDTYINHKLSWIYVVSISIHLLVALKDSFREEQCFLQN